MTELKIIQLAEGATLADRALEVHLADLVISHDGQVIKDRNSPNVPRAATVDEITAANTVNPYPTSETVEQAMEAPEGEPTHPSGDVAVAGGTQQENPPENAA